MGRAPSLIESSYCMTHVNIEMALPNVVLGNVCNYKRTDNIGVTIAVAVEIRINVVTEGKPLYFSIFI